MKKTIKKLVLQRETLARVRGGITAPSYRKCPDPNPQTVQVTHCLACATLTSEELYCCLIG